MEKMYKRLGRYALDPENKKTYLVRAEQWAQQAEKWENYHTNKLAKAVKSDIIQSAINRSGSGQKAMEYTSLGKLNTMPLVEEFGELQTDDVIVTDERLDHIKTHHPEDYKLFIKYGKETAVDPDEIIVDTKHSATVFMVKHLPDTNLNVIVKLALDSDKPNLKNSVMTFFRIREKNLVKLRKKSKTLYKKE